MMPAIASGETACASRSGGRYSRVSGVPVMCGATAWVTRGLDEAMLSTSVPFCTDQDVFRFMAREVSGPHRILVIYR